MVRFFTIVAFIVLVASGVNTAYAIDIPVQNHSQTQSDTALYVTQDRSQMLTMDQEAASVIVGNPNHINVILDTPKTLIVVPRAAGTSHFSVIGRDGTVLLEKQVIVGMAPPAKKALSAETKLGKYLRIRRSCGNGTGSCDPISTYYCNSACHEVIENSGS